MSTKRLAFSLRLLHADASTLDVFEATYWFQLHHPEYCSPHNCDTNQGINLLQLKT